MSEDERGRVPEHAAIKKFYDEDYHRHATAGSGLPWHQVRVADRLGALDGCDVLDVACGTGEWLAELRRRGARVSGVDISSRAVEACRARLPDADVRESVAERLPFDTASFDLVSCLGSLEHFVDQLGALREMVRVARPDATVLVLVPNAGFLTRRLGLYGGTGQAAVRETVRPLPEWEAMLGDAGLLVVDRWRDLHTLSWKWVRLGRPWWWPLRALQAALLAVWPVPWQYQVYFRCTVSDQIPDSGRGTT